MEEMSVQTALSVVVSPLCPRLSVEPVTAAVGGGLVAGDVATDSD